jgi:two-component system response regulator ChvI
MICDDDKDILGVISKGLEMEGFKVHAFSDPAAALQHVEGGCAECEMLVTDVRMPSMNGFQLVRRVRDIRRDIKVVMMTAFEVNLPEFEEVFPSMKADAVIRKPFAPTKLVETIKQIYGKEMETAPAQVRNEDNKQSRP